MRIKHSVAFFLSLFIVFQSSMPLAEQAQYRGKVLKYSGDVKILTADDGKRQLTKQGAPLKEMDTVVTGEGARVVMQFDDGTLSSLDEKSRLRVEKSSWYSYLGGKIYFTFKKVFGEPRHVRTSKATIGIRGTTFIISEDIEQGSASVALKEGLLQIQSTGPVFEIHRKEVLDEFARFKQQHEQAQAATKKEFEQYKQQVQREFVEYRHSFTLQSNRAISLTGYRIDEAAMSDADRAAFDLFESDAKEQIKQFRARSKALIAK